MKTLIDRFGWLVLGLLVAWTFLARPAQASFVPTLVRSWQVATATWNGADADGALDVTLGTTLTNYQKTLVIPLGAGVTSANSADGVVNAVTNCQWTLTSTTNARCTVGDTAAPAGGATLTYTALVVELF